MSHYCIYSLNEPDTETVRYIGLTGKTLKERLWGHTSKSKLKTRKASWILSLKNKGTKPDIILIEDGLSLEEAKKKEVHYILMFKSFGARLVNGTAGGDGLFNCTQEVRDKIGAAHRGKKLSPEHIESIRKRMKGRKPSPRLIEAIKKAHTGKKLSKEVRLKISIGKIGNKNMTDSGKKKLSALYKGVKIPEERRLRMIGKKQSIETINKRRDSIKMAISKRTKDDLERIKKNRKKLTDNQMEDVIRDFKNGRSMLFLSKKYNLNYGTMFRYIKEYKK